jgi:hypothetical protein
MEGGSDTKRRYSRRFVSNPLSESVCEADLAWLGCSALAANGPQQALQSPCGRPCAARCERPLGAAGHRRVRMSLVVHGVDSCGTGSNEEMTDRPASERWVRARSTSNFIDARWRFRDAPAGGVHGYGTTREARSRASPAKRGRPRLTSVGCLSHAYGAFDSPHSAERRPASECGPFQPPIRCIGRPTRIARGLLPHRCRSVCGAGRAEERLRVPGVRRRS